MIPVIVREVVATPAGPVGKGWPDIAHLGPQQVCCACRVAKGLDAGDPYARKGDARFCPDCWRCLPASEIERVVREVALCGVPLS